MWRQQWLIWEPSLATEDFMEFSQLIINYPEDKLCLHYEFNSNRRGSLTENAANTSPPLGWKRVKFKIPTKSQVKRLKTQVQSQVKIRVKTQGKVCKLWWCKNNDSMPCKRLTKTRFWHAKKGLREATETLNILTTVSLSQQQVDYLMTFVMIMIKVKSRFILISK